MKNNKLNFKNSQGQIMLIMVVFFLVISLFVVLGLSYTVAKDTRIIKNNLLSKQSYYVSESGVEDVLYRIKNSKDFGTTEILNLDGAQATTTVSDVGSGVKLVHTEAEVSDFTKKIETKILAGDGVSFNYGIQTGNGGLVMSGSSKIVGNVYSNGDIITTGPCEITGSAVAAIAGSDLDLNQKNDSPATPTSGISFGNTSNTQDIAQSFVPTATAIINHLEVNLKRSGNAGNLVVKIVADDNGQPGNNVLTQTNLSSGNVTTNYGWVSVTFTSNPTLIQGTVYWLVLDNDGYNSGKYYIFGANTDSYMAGVPKVGTFGGSWVNLSPATRDLYFRLFLGGVRSQITGSYAQALSIGSVSGDFAHADLVTNTKVTGPLYCQTGSNNNKDCDSSLPNPAGIGMPLSEAQIDSWKEDASAGGTIVGDYNVTGSDNKILGPKKITGNLHIGNSGVLSMTNTVYVQGNIIIDGSGKLKLASSYADKSGIIIADGYIFLGGSGEIKGSGQVGSYVLMVTTSACPDVGNCSGSNAITVNGSAGAVVLNAQKGTVYFSGSASAKESSANKTVLEGSAIVEYESGLIDMKFVSGPSGGWNITSWQEVE